MAIQNPRVFGLAVPRNFTDIPDPDRALLNLGLDIRDLEVIRGAAAAGFDSNDLQTISGLTVPIWKTFDRYITDVGTYNNQLSTSAGTDLRTKGNLEVLGPISSNAFRYTLFDGTNENSLRWGDISTSRVSSWSSFTASISYGSDVKISGAVFAGKLKTRDIPTERTFESEIPTHRIKLRLNGADRYFYVMKGIPIRFKGFFRDFDFTLNFLTQTVRNSWRVYRIDGTELQDFANIGGFSSSTLNYRSPFSAERYIEAYINPEIVTRAVLNNCNITDLPKSRLPVLNDLQFANNGLTTFPDLNFFAPNLTILNIDNNPFYNGPTIEEQTLTKKIVARIPDSLITLDASGCFKGGVQQNIFNRFQALSTIDIDRVGSVYFYADSTNQLSEVPNFYGIAGNPVTHAIKNISFVDHDFRTIQPGVQGGIDEATLAGGSGGNGSYANGGAAVYSNVSLTNVTVNDPSAAGATANITVEGGLVVGVEITSVGSSYTVGDQLSADTADLGNTGGAGFICVVSDIINVLSIKEQENLVTVDVNSNNLLNDSNFSLNCPSTLTTLSAYYTQLTIPNFSAFTALSSIDFGYGSNRGSLHSGWDGTFGGVGYPRSDQQNFKFNDCPSLTSINLNYSDVRGYLPKYQLVPNLTSYNFYATNNIIAGRPGKRKIISLLEGGGVVTLGAAPTPNGGRPYTANNVVEASDTLANSNATLGATVRVYTDNSGDVRQLDIVNPGAGYTLLDTITIDAQLLGSRNKPDLQISITEVAEGTIGSNDYTPGTYDSIEDSAPGPGFGINARVSFTIPPNGANPTQYSLVNPGQDYQTGEVITIPTSAINSNGDVLGGSQPLQFIIAEAEPAKILYNDQFIFNPNITRIDININNPLFAGEIESGAFSPIRTKLQFLRLQAAGRITGNFPNLEDQTALREVWSSSQGWEGPLPSFSSAQTLQELYLSGNNFTGTFLYQAKPVLRIISLSNNNIEEIDNFSELPACETFNISNNNLSGTLPRLDNIMPSVEFVGLDDNQFTGYDDGTFGSLFQLRTLDLSGNQLGTSEVDNILFDMVDNYQGANRSNVTVNLTGGQMAPPTPYPVTGGIIETLSFLDQPTIVDGILTDIGSTDNVPAGFVPVAGTFECILNNGSGSGGRATIEVVNDYLEGVPIAINTIPSFSGTVGEVTGISLPTEQPPLESQNVQSTGTGQYDATDDGSLAQNNGDPAFVPATIRLFYNAGFSQTYPESIQILNPGAGYSLQGTPDRIVIPALAVNNINQQPIEIDITSVQEFTNGTATYTDTGANTAAGSGAAVSVTVGRGGLDITSSLVDPDITPGSGYLDTEQITISLPGSMPNSGTTTYDIDTVQDEYYTDTSYSVVLLNSGGENYSVSDVLTTSEEIPFRNPTTLVIQNGALQLQVDSVRSQTNKAVFTGFGAVEFLRSKGWTVRVES